MGDANGDKVGTLIHLPPWAAFLWRAGRVRTRSSISATCDRLTDGERNSYCTVRTGELRVGWAIVCSSNGADGFRRHAATGPFSKGKPAAKSFLADSSTCVTT